jgi:hypothetical protein
LSTKNGNIGKKWKEIFTSVDDLFIIFGILLNGASAIVSLIEGHLIAGLILSACEIALLVAYIMKII